MRGGVRVAAGGVLTPLGELEATWKGLLAGRSGLATCKVQSVAEPLLLGMIEGLEGAFGSAARQRALFTALQQQLAGVSLSAQDGLFVACTKGAVDELRGSGEGQVWQVAGELGRCLGLQPRPLTSAACVSGLLALIQAAMRLERGEFERALVVGFDLLSEFVVSGFASLRGLTETTPRPFDVHRDGLAPAEGMGWLLLERGQGGVAVESFGIACDATHITAPSREAKGLKAVLRQVAERCGRDLPLAPGGIIGHGTATSYNDAMELRAFGDLCAAGTPLCSLKGALGHSFAGSGIVEAVVGMRCLQENLLPPTVGLERAEESPCSLAATAQVLVAKSLLTTNSGFGGINAGVLLNVCRA